MLDFFSLTLSFIRRNLKNPLYVIRYAYAFFQKDFENHASFLTNEELIQELENGKSLLRYGDGEIYMMNYGSIPQYEPYNKDLRRHLFEIVKNYKPSSPYIVGVPIFVNTPNHELRKDGKIKNGKLNVWLPLKVLYHFTFPHNVKYFDAHLFYREGGFERSLDLVLKKYKVIIVTRLFNINLMKEAGIEGKFDVSFLITPERESFKKVDEIFKELQNRVGNDKDKYRIILATGPASKVLVYKLSNIGIVSYDIGRGIEAVYRRNEIEHFI